MFGNDDRLKTSNIEKNLKQERDSRKYHSYLLHFIVILLILYWMFGD